MPQKIIYTKTDEAPYLATKSLLPIIRRFLASAEVTVELKDISLAGRILAAFSDYLKVNQKVDDDLAYLGELVKLPEANIIKLPNISASLPQLHAAIKELQEKGFKVPDYPEDPNTPEEIRIQKRYNAIKGSAVNPVLREGNSDRRAPKAAKAFAKQNPHQMGKWSPDSETHVSTMSEGDFLHNERSLTVSERSKVSIEFTNREGEKITLKEEVDLLAGEVIDASFMSKRALDAFLEREFKLAKQSGILYSVHLKATMMKVSDPIIFGQVLKSFLPNFFETNAAILEEIGANPKDGLLSIIKLIEERTGGDLKQELLEQIQIGLAEGPALAMVNSDKGISNLHVPSDVIIDASMPAMIRNGGKMWNAKGETQDTKAIIPDSTYADLYKETIAFCKAHGAFDPATMGTVPNIGLMAQKAEEYGSHDKTFEISESGVVEVINQNGEILCAHEVEEGDIWRMCQVKDAAIRNWIKLAVERARATGWPTVFWLDKARAHDAELIKKIEAFLPELETDDLEILIKSPKEATRYTLERVREGLNTISVTGNVLRDYLTDLFPILELGTSAKMLSIVPLMNGGGLFETGAGGSAPKHVAQFLEENHLRWDSLGEFLALAVSLEHLAQRYDNSKARVLAETLDKATAKLLLEDKSPKRKVKEADNRSSHFYLAKFWAEELAEQTQDPELAREFKPMAEGMQLHEAEISKELIDVQGQTVDMEGYYKPNRMLLYNLMRPSKAFNLLIDFDPDLI